jgi:hypothetical protein
VHSQQMEELVRKIVIALAAVAVFTAGSAFSASACGAGMGHGGGGGVALVDFGDKSGALYRNPRFQKSRGELFKAGRTWARRNPSRGGLSSGAVQASMP